MTKAELIKQRIEALDKTIELLEMAREELFHELDKEENK
jgi:hypothetical protein